ncbi:MAG: ATP synthase F1 subunit delta [Planctomycetes bacterium]|nr:ATP synthase F1 subunit delta [Planctomycetota bacterium]
MDETTRIIAGLGWPQDISRERLVASVFDRAARGGMPVAAEMILGYAFDKTEFPAPATREDKLALMEKLFSDHVTPLTMHAFRLLLKRRRENLIDHVRMEYAELRRKHENLTYALVESCVKLGEHHRSAIIDKVSKASGKRVEAEFIVSSDIIGGVRVTYDNFVLDGTARGYLNRMKNRLLYDLLKQA